MWQRVRRRHVSLCPEPSSVHITRAGSLGVTQRQPLGCEVLRQGCSSGKDSSVALWVPYPTQLGLDYRGRREVVPQSDCSGHKEGTVWGSHWETLRGRLIVGLREETVLATMIWSLKINVT